MDAADATSAAAVTATSPATPPISDSDSPRSSNTSASNEKIDLPAARRSSSSQKSNGNVVNRAASTKRWKTFRKSFKYLYHLNEKQVDDFMSSYVIYNLDWENEAEMIERLGPNYQEKVGDALRAYYGVMNHL